MAGWLRNLYGRPHWRLYAATDSGEVVGGACLYIGGELAWFGWERCAPHTGGVAGSAL